ncbi:hypothetical protein GCM10028791_18580 [Echinicola sediminis]
MKFTTVILISLFPLIFSNCTEKAKPDNEKAALELAIEVISDELIFISGKEYSLTEFSKAVEEHLQIMKETGAKVDGVFVNLVASPSVKMGTVADIQGALKDLNLRKIKYSGR